MTIALKYGTKVLDINKWKVSQKFTGVIIQAEKGDLGEFAMKNNNCII